MRPVFCVALVITVLGAANVHAADTTRTKLAKVQRVMELTRFDQTIAMGARTCIETNLAGPTTPAAVAIREGSYHGLTPKSPDWPQLLASYERLTQKTCSIYEQIDLRKIYIDYYERQVTEADLDSVIQYLSSPAGQAFARVQDEFMRVMTREVQRRGQPIIEAAQQAFNADLKQLVLKEQERQKPAWWQFWR